MTPPTCLKTNKELWSPNGIMNVIFPSPQIVKFKIMLPHCASDHCRGEYSQAWYALGDEQMKGIKISALL